MRRFIIQKKANSLIFSDKTGARPESEEPVKLPRPQTSCKKTQVTYQSPYIDTDNSNTSSKSYKKTQLLYLETLGNYKEDFITGIKTNQRYSKKSNSSGFYMSETSTHNKKTKKIQNFCIKGRPLTAHTSSSEPRKTPQITTLKNRSSIFSNGDSDIVTPLDPKFYDEECTMPEEFTKLLQNPRSRTSIGILANGLSIQERNPIEESDLNTYTFSPQYYSNPKHPANKRVGLLVTTPYAPSTKTVAFKRKGKLLKGLSNKPIIPNKSKRVHNIQIS